AGPQARAARLRARASARRPAAPPADGRLQARAGREVDEHAGLWGSDRGDARRGGAARQLDAHERRAEREGAARALTRALDRVPHHAEDRRVALDHVTLEIPVKRLADCAAFWELLGWERVQLPEQFADRNAWVIDGRTAIHLIASDEPV